MLRWMKVFFQGWQNTITDVDLEKMHGDKKWGFGLTERGSLDAIIEQVPSNRSWKVLIPIIDKHCLDGTIFCSDGWKAYDKLKEHVQLDDCLHFPVNHSKNDVDPQTGAYTSRGYVEPLYIISAFIWNETKGLAYLSRNFLVDSILQTTLIGYVHAFSQMCN